MLPKELLDSTKIKGKIKPKFAGEDLYDLSKKIIRIYQLCKGRKLKYAKNELKKLENPDNYKKVRGFSKIVERSIITDKSTSLDPLEVRRFLFSRGFVTSVEERNRIIDSACRKFNVDREEIENSIFADLDEESTIKDVNIDYEEVVRRYNLGLLQATLFNAVKVDFRVSENHQKIFRMVKLLGLMYELKNGSVRLYGPASILKSTRRYGTSFAKLIPLIVSVDKWMISAEVLDDFTNRIYQLSVSSDDGILLPKVKREVEFDSELERELYNRLKASRPDLEISREPDVISVGDFAFIPDFRLRKGEKEVYIEIAGFWTEDYLRNKIEKIRNSKVPLILVGREEMDVKLDDVIFIPFSKKLPYLRILKSINSFFKEERDINSIISDLTNKKIVNLGERIDLSSDTLSEVISRLDTHVYHNGWLFEKRFVEKVKKKVEQAEIEDILEIEGITILLDFLGYKLVWDGLSADRVIVVRK